MAEAAKPASWARSSRTGANPARRIAASRRRPNGLDIKLVSGNALVRPYAVARGALRLEQEGREHQRLLARVLEAQAEADALSDELVRAQKKSAVNAERTRLAHDIHDTLAQGFSSVLFLTQAAACETDPERPQELLTQIRVAAAENLTESRRVVYALAPDDLTTGGVAAPLTRITSELATQLNADVTIVLDPNLPRLHTATEVAILRAAQGALANVRRHAGASHVQVTLARADDPVRLDIVDDGVGFDPTAIAAEPILAGGYGLRALGERLAAIGGGLAIESEPGQGTARLFPRRAGRHDHGPARRRPPRRPLRAPRTPRRRTVPRRGRRRGHAEEALQLVATLDPDVVLSDLRLGDGIGGVTLTETLRRGGERPAVIILTTYDNDSDIVRAVMAGAAGYLLKTPNPR